MVATRRRLTLASLTLALAGVAAAGAYAQAPQTDRLSPDFRVEIWGDALAVFRTRVLAYAELRRELQKGLPPQRVTADRAETRRTERALARRIRVARAGGRRGDIFTAPITVAFKKALVQQMDGGTWAAIMDDNPGGVHTDINGAYPGKTPLSTVPPNILSALPALPDEIEYRFVGRDLVLLDTAAGVVLDRLPSAIR